MNINQFKDNLSVVILCGGKGARLKPLTNDLPKPLVKINNKSILENILLYFLKFKINNFIIASGYKKNLIKNFFKKKFVNHSIKAIHNNVDADIIVRLKNSFKYSKKYLLICYGDTMIDINFNKYIQFFLKKPSEVTVVSYQLKSNFGILDIDKNNYVKNFREKPTLDIWYNVGYILLSRDNFKLFNKFSNFKNFLKFLSKNKKMRTFKHFGNHITINTIQELENARSQIKKFNLNEEK